jgi:hypothetical protein
MLALALHYLLVGLLPVPLSASTPIAVWPSEFFCYTNITHAEQQDDVGSMFYSFKSGAQRVDHSNLFNSSVQALTIWSDSFYTITNNGQDCCVYEEFDFPMASTIWTSFLAYTMNETIIGVDCHKFENASMQVTYWQSIKDGTPVAWTNYLAGNGPITQYFTSVVVSQTQLPADLFILPDSCKTPTVCSTATDGTSDGTTTDTNKDDEKDVMSTSMLAGIIVGTLAGFAVIAGGAYYLNGKYRDKASDTNKSPLLL